MPIYEYRCESCGHELEAIQKFSDDPLVDCPACEQSSLKKLISAAAFRLKGGGWYETDFKKDSDRKRNLAESGDKSAGGKEKSESGAKAKSDSGAKTADKPAKSTKTSTAAGKSGA